MTLTKVDRGQVAMAHQFFLSTLRAAGYSQEECEAISRGMTVSSFRGEMPSDNKQYDKLIASWNWGDCSKLRGSRSGDR
jgi:hypothetical protein